MIKKQTPKPIYSHQKGAHLVIVFEDDESKEYDIDRYYGKYYRCFKNLCKDKCRQKKFHKLWDSVPMVTWECGECGKEFCDKVIKKDLICDACRMKKLLRAAFNAGFNDG